MKYITNYIICLITITIIFNTSCTNSPTGSEPDLPETLESVEEVQPIQGGDNATITVKKNQEEAYFNIHFSNIDANKVIETGTREAWCIDWTKPLDSSNGTYNGVKLYSTDLVEKWEPLNYLLNIIQELKSSDPDLTWREIQVAIWSLRANPEFDLDTVTAEELSSAFTNDGEPNFSYEKVREILEIVENGYREFDFSAGTKFAVIAETPVDVQTVFTVVEKK